MHVKQLIDINKHWIPQKNMTTILAETPLTVTSVNSKTGFRPLQTFPLELLLEVIPRIKYSPQALTNLRLAGREVNEILDRYECSLVCSIKKNQFKHTQLQLFPGLSGKHTWSSLKKLYIRLETLEDVHDQWLEIVSHGLELQWLKGRWENIHKAGLLLLYRLQDAGNSNNPEHESSEWHNHAAKIALLESLPASSLACLLFKLISSIKILRIYGPEPINGSYAQDDVLQRSDIELAFEELLLRHGPAFFVVMLKSRNMCGPQKDEWAIKALRAEIDGMIARQMPLPSGSPQAPTLISSLRRAQAKASGCEVHATVGKMWEILSCTGFDEVGDKTMAKIVRGESVEGGMRTDLRVV